HASARGPSRRALARRLPPSSGRGRRGHRGSRRVSDSRKNAICRQMSGEAGCRIVARSGSVRKSGNVLQGRGVEALRREPSERPGACVGLQERACPRRLRLERSEGACDRLSGEAFRLEPGPDRGVPEPSPGEPGRAAACHAAVVEEAGPLERVERIGRSRASREPLGEALPRMVAVPQRPDGDLQRLRATELPREGTRGLAVERPSYGETAPDDGVRGREPPRGAVELDLDAPPRPLAQRGDDAHGYSAAPTSATAAAAAAAFAALLDGSPFSGTSSSTGSRRAETTCSGPISSWICWRICCVTSGCSRRNAVAFWRPWPSRSSPKLK